MSLFAPGVQQPVGSILNGSLNSAVFPMPGGTQVMYASQGLFLYCHSDWLGSARTSSYSYPSGGLVYSNAYAPFGESYATNGTTGNLDFTGQSQDMASGIYDFPFRHLSASQGRWLSPDPAGVAAVDVTNPQSWNRYAYVLNNPLGMIDPLGLECLTIGGGTWSVSAGGETDSGTDPVSVVCDNDTFQNTSVEAADSSRCRTCRRCRSSSNNSDKRVNHISVVSERP